MDERRVPRGFTLVELVLAIAIASLLFAGLAGVVHQTLRAHDDARERTALTAEARFAMQRMVEAVSRSERLLLPLADNPATGWREHVREQSVPAAAPETGSTLATAVLAVTLDPTIDRNADGWADANNDKDFQDLNGNATRDAGEPERIDEDPSHDVTNDGANGIKGIDDDGDGAVDEGGSDAVGAYSDDDEDGAFREDWVDGVDNDGDGRIDEDWPSDVQKDNKAGVAGVDDDGDGTVDEGPGPDDDEDGLTDEDWLDAVVYYLSGTTLMERQPSLTDVNGDSVVTGADYVARAVAENVSFFRVERVPRAASDRAEQVDLTLTLTGASGRAVTLQRRVRLAAGL